MKECSVEGCSALAYRKKGLCKHHHWRLNTRMRKYGRTHLIRRENGTGSIGPRGYVSIMKDGKRVMEHVLIAERALGKKLPPRAEVHHVDRNPSNNATSNLVICPSRAYHMLLHKRMKDLGYD